VATRKYAIVTDSSPAFILDEVDNQERALSSATELLMEQNVFIQQYINGRVGKSWTPAQLASSLKK
jgi:hypothetical protein